MVLQVVELALVYLSHISYAHVGTAERYVEGQFGVQGGHIEGVDKDGILVVVSEDESFVVALPIVGREGHSCHGHADLSA